MTNKNQEQCSCLVDGELEESECCGILDKISGNEKLKQGLHRYFLIRDTLQSSLPSIINTKFSQSVMDAIESEPTILAPMVTSKSATDTANPSSTPQKSNISQHHYPKRIAAKRVTDKRVTAKRVASFAIAASVATIAIFTFNSTNNVEQAVGPIAQMPDNSEFIRLSKSTSAAPKTKENILVSQPLKTTSRPVKTTTISSQQIQKYIINYNHHISSSRLQSVTPYARIIAAKTHNQTQTQIREQNPQ